MNIHSIFGYILITDTKVFTAKAGLEPAAQNTSTVVTNLDNFSRPLKKEDFFLVLWYRTSFRSLGDE